MWCVGEIGVRAEGVGSGNRFGNVATALQAHRAGHAVEPMRFLYRLGLGIETHHCRQQHRLQRAMVQARIDAAQSDARRVVAQLTLANKVLVQLQLGGRYRKLGEITSVRLLLFL